MNQSYEITLNRWRRFTRPQQILNVAADLLRASERLHNVSDAQMCYESALELTDRTIQVNTGFSFRWELCRLRELLADAYQRLPNVSRAEHDQLLKTLLCFTPESAKQVELLGL
jgi:hypothetical protein